MGGKLRADGSLCHSFCHPTPTCPQDADRSKADVGGEGPHTGALRLLKDISGVFRPGVLTALMGASGAGGREWVGGGGG